MKLLTVAALVAASLAMATPASALTNAQYQAEIAGYKCAGNACTKATNTTIQSTSYETKYSSRNNGGMRENVCYDKFGAFYFSSTGRVQDCVLDVDGYVSKIDTVTTLNNDAACTVVTKTGKYNGPTLDSPTAFILSVSSATNPGSCKK